jgi:hypothetical protein
VLKAKTPSKAGSLTARGLKSQAKTEILEFFFLTQANSFYIT